MWAQQAGLRVELGEALLSRLTKLLHQHGPDLASGPALEEVVQLVRPLRATRDFVVRLPDCGQSVAFVPPTNHPNPSKLSKTWFTHSSSSSKDAEWAWWWRQLLAPSQVQLLPVYHCPEFHMSCFLIPQGGLPPPKFHSWHYHIVNF